MVVWWLWLWVRSLIFRFRPKIVGITGSVGKTTAKEAIFHLLKSDFTKIEKVQGNLNTEVGIPLALLGFKPPISALDWLITLGLVCPKALFRFSFPAIWLIEYAADKPGDIGFLVRKLPPDLVLLTRISEAHLENFQSLEAVAAEKLLLALRSKPEAVIIRNFDDELQTADFDQRPTFSYGFKAGDLQLKNLKFSKTGFRGYLTEGKKKALIETRLFNRGLLESTLGAMAVARQFSLSLKTIARRIGSFRPIAGRGRIVPGVKNSIILDESYNASPASVKAACQTLADFPRSGRKVAILGDMRELGREAVFLHRLTGESVAHQADLFILVGDHRLDFQAGLFSAGQSSKSIQLFRTTGELIEKIKAILEPSDTILVKASQNNLRFEKVVEALMRDKRRAARLLVRQTGFWKKKAI